MSNKTAFVNSLLIGTISILGACESTKGLTCKKPQAGTVAKAKPVASPQPASVSDAHLVDTAVAQAPTPVSPAPSKPTPVKPHAEIQKTKVAKSNTLNFEISKEELAQCLQATGAVMYGSEACGWTQREMRLFGNSSSEVPFFDCRGNNRQNCTKHDVGPYPEWQFTNGQKLVRSGNLEEIAEVSGCKQWIAKRHQLQDEASSVKEARIPAASVAQDAADALTTATH
jgi:hypothetical protein